MDEMRGENASYFTTRQKLSLMRSLFTKTSPAYVQYYVTARCNLACEQCNIIYAQGDVEEMNLSQIRAMARNLADIGVCIVLLIGGEPFVRQDLPEVVRAFSDVGIHVRLQTNGLATEKSLAACIEAGAHDISISLDSLEGSRQEVINGGFAKSWHRAIETMAIVNGIFPANGTAFFGTVLMPRNLFHIRDVIEFAAAIGWGVSLVPAHVTSQHAPMGFRTFDDTGVCTFPPESYPLVRSVLDEVKEMKRAGLPVYDSEEYLDDIYRFIAGEPLEWRSRNGGVCDSPNLYFAIEPNGCIQPCCDYKMDTAFPIYAPEFPELYRGGTIQRAIEPYTHTCSGCLYGSYPEITVSARYLRHMWRRFFFFNKDCFNHLQPLSAEEMLCKADEIYIRNQRERELRHVPEVVA